MTGEAQVFDVLQELSDRFNGVDNGYCTLCHRHRSYNTRGKVQPCSNAECLSHKITAALSGEDITENSLVNDFISHLGRQLRLATEECDKLRRNPSPVAVTVDAETLNKLLDALPEIPSEEQAEAVLQAAGTSGKEVVNGFIERLLRENIELKTKLNTARHYFCSCGGALTAEEYIEHYFEKGHDHGEPQLLFKAAAAEIVKAWLWHTPEHDQERARTSITAILSKHLGSAAVGEQGESGWLLEKMHDGNVHYITADYVLQWTDDPNSALRLSRREDAEALCTIVEDCEKIASHEWVPATPTSTQT